MRKYLFAIIALSACALVACNKNETAITTEPAGTIEMTVTAGDVTTKTAFNGGETGIIWSGTEKLRVIEGVTGGTDNGKYFDKESSAGTSSDAGATMDFSVTMDTHASATGFQYVALYPSSSFNKANSFTNIAVNTLDAQNPTASNFDPAADMLISQVTSESATQPTSINMAFARKVAIGKMTIKNLGSSEDITSVAFSAKKGATDVVLAGRSKVDFSTSTVDYGSNIQSKTLTLDYSGDGIKLNSAEGAPIYFISYPFLLNVANEGQFTVVVETETKRFTRTVTLTGEQTLQLKAGDVSRFSVDMSTAVEAPNAVDLRYACLTGAEYNGAGGTNSYGNVTVEKPHKPHGDKWVTCATCTNSCIGIGNLAANSNAKDSYIKTPELVENIKTIILTFNTSSNSTTYKVLLVASATGNEESGLIASKTFNQMDGDNKLTFDLTSESYKTVYIRAKGAQAVVSKIEVYAGEDNRAAIAPAPTSVTAVLNTDNPAVTNKIDVSWTAAENASGYIVTLTPAAGDPVAQNVAANVTSTSFTGLSYSTSYTPSVITIADPYLYKANSASTEGSAVATEAANYAFTTVAGLNALVTTTSTEYNGHLTDAVVSFVPATNTAIIKDATGSVMIYKSSHGLLQGQTYTGDITVTAIKYSSLYSEITAWSNATFTGAQTPVAPENVELSSLVGHYGDFQNAYVQVSGLTVSSVAGKTINVSDGVNSYVVFDNPGTASCIAGDEITVKGTITKYNSTEQIKVWSASDITITTYAPRAITFSQPTGAAGTAGCSFTVTKTVGGDSVTSGNAIASGTGITLTATAGTGYEFTSWTVTGATVADASDATTTFTMGTSPVTISATFTSTSGGDPDPTLQYTLDGNITGSGSAYSNANDITQTIGWKVTGNTQQTPWRVGGKEITNQDRAIYSTGAIAANISQIRIKHGDASSITVNSMTVSVHSTSADAAAGLNAIATFTPTFVANGTVTIDNEGNTSWAGKYYRIVYNVTVSGSSNKFIQFKSAEFWGVAAN